MQILLPLQGKSTIKLHTKPNQHPNQKSIFPPEKNFPLKLPHGKPEIEIVNVIILITLPTNFFQFNCRIRKVFSSRKHIAINT